MKVFCSVSNQSGRDSAIAVKALARRLSLGSCDSLGQPERLRVPANFRVSSPSKFSIGWCNPNSCREIGMADEKSPLSFQARDIFVADFFGAQRINHSEISVFENEFRSYPQHVNQRSSSDSKNQVEKDIAGTAVVEDGLNQIQGIQNEGNDGPGEVALRSKNEVFIHSYIIAGKFSVEKGRS